MLAELSFSFGFIVLPLFVGFYFVIVVRTLKLRSTPLTNFLSAQYHIV